MPLITRALAPVATIKYDASICSISLESLLTVIFLLSRNLAKPSKTSILFFFIKPATPELKRFETARDLSIILAKSCLIFSAEKPN